MHVSNATSVKIWRSCGRDVTLEALVSTAMRLFAEQGCAATRIEDIATAAGYTRGAFYFHFQSKLECLAG